MNGGKMSRYGSLGIMLLTALLFPTVLAAQGPGVEVKALYWLPSLEADLAATSGPLIGTTVNTTQDLGIGDENILVGAGELAVGWLHFTGSFWSTSFSGTQSLTRSVTYAGTVFNISDTVSSTIDLDVYEVGCYFDVFPHADVTFAPYVRVYWFNFDASIASSVYAASGTAQLDILVPAAGGVIKADLTDTISLDIVATYTSYKVNSMWDLKAELSYKAVPGIALLGGYRTLNADVDESGVTVDASLNGPYLGGKIEF